MTRQAVTGSARDTETAQAQERALPDFLGIGALKAGTSYLDAMLRSHPDRSLPLHLKEVEFFTHHLGRGADLVRRAVRARRRPPAR